MDIKKLITLFMLLTNCCFAQESYWGKYYNILSTELDISNIHQVDSSFQVLFRDRVTYNQVLSAYNKIKHHEEINHEYYIKKLLLIGRTPRITKKDCLHNSAFNGSFKDIKKEYKKERQRMSRQARVTRRKIRGMMTRDIIARRLLKKRMGSVDKKNSTKVDSIIKDIATLKELDQLSLNLLSILIYHGGWKHFNKSIDYIQELTVKRILPNDGLVEIIERESMYEGTMFKVKDGNLRYYSNLSSPICEENSLFYSITGLRQYLFGDKFVYVPINPSLTIEEVDDLREYLCLPPLSNRTNFVTPKNHKVIYAKSADEWCEFINNKNSK